MLLFRKVITIIGLLIIVGCCDHKVSEAMNYDVVISDITRIKAQDYLTSIKSNPGIVGNHLASTFQKHQVNINELNIEQFIDLLLKSKKPTIFAEDPRFVTCDKRTWNKQELSILGDINISMDVEVYDNGKFKEPFEPYREPFTAMLLYTPGALLKNTESPDFQEVVKKGQFDPVAFKELYKRRLLPLLLHANKDSVVHGQKGFVAIPGLGCGQFAGIYKHQVIELFPQVVTEIINENKDKLPNLIGYRITPGPGVLTKVVSGNPAIIVEDPYTSLPLLSLPEKYGREFKDCKLYKMVAWDHVSWPGNDFYYQNTRATDDGVSAAATSTIEVVTGIKGNYRNGKYLPPETNKDWQQIVLERDLSLSVKDNLFFYNINLHQSKKRIGSKI